MDLLRGQHNLAGTTARFPRPGTLVEVYSRCVNTGKPLSEVVPLEYPWCEPHLGADGRPLPGLYGPQAHVRPARLRRPSALLACSRHPGRMGTVVCPRASIMYWSTSTRTSTAFRST